MNATKVKFVRLVNKLSSVRAFAYPISNLALMCVFEVNQRFIVQNWIAPDKLC